MLVENSSKLHPELDFHVVRRVYVEAGLDKNLKGELITSPFDLFSVEMLRDMHGLRFGDALPTDVFVFGKGEPPHRDCTKVGGLPYWPAGKPWPRTGDGTTYHFLAQFNFADSKDLFPDLPGDVLLLLTDGPEEWIEEPDRVRFEWLPLGLDPCAEFDPVVPCEFAGAFYGAIYRTADYLDAIDKAAEVDVSENFNLPILNGTKIGGFPHFIQPAEGLSGRFLCQLGSIQAEPHVPYPWVNQSMPLDGGFNKTGIHGESNEVCFADMGTVYVAMDSAGNLTHDFQCY